MTKLEKLYEAIGIITECERPLFMKFSSLRLSKANQARLMPFAKALTKACEDFENELLTMIEEEKGKLK